MTLLAKVVKGDQGQELRLVYGEVYAPNLPDSHGEFMTPEEVRKMAHKFMRDMQQKAIDVQHDNQLAEDCCIVESWIARDDDPTFIPGAWCVCMQVLNDDIWTRIKNGELNGFSMEALVTQEAVEVNLVYFPTVSGQTTEVAGHVHNFVVYFDTQGNFLGGHTSDSLGHWHEIKRGTMTEDASAGEVPLHHHLFSFLENFGYVEQPESPST